MGPCREGRKSERCERRKGGSQAHSQTRRVNGVLDEEGDEVVDVELRVDGSGTLCFESCDGIESDRRAESDPVKVLDGVRASRPVQDKPVGIEAGKACKTKQRARQLCPDSSRPQETALTVHTTALEEDGSVSAWLELELCLANVTVVSSFLDDLEVSLAGKKQGGDVHCQCRAMRTV